MSNLKAGTTIGGYKLVTINDYSALNQINKLVMRDSAGDFAANVITANSFVGALTGNATTASALTAGPKQITKNAHASGAGDYHLELFSPDVGVANEISLRFHQSNRWYGQLRYRSDGFHFTNGDSNTYQNIFFGTATGALTGNATNITGTLAIANGGTNITTYAAGDILYASAANVLSKLPKGADGQVLKLVSGLPAWGADNDTNTWRGIDTTPVSGENAESISSGWAYTHENATSVHGATSTNTASRIVMRDSAGDFTTRSITVENSLLLSALTSQYAVITGDANGVVFGNASNQSSYSGIAHAFSSNGFLNFAIGGAAGVNRIQSTTDAIVFLNRLDNYARIDVSDIYINGTDSLVTALGQKQTIITGAATTIDTENLTASRVLVSDGSGKVAVSSITTTALSYLDATSSIQTQLNGKQASLGYTPLNIGGGTMTGILYPQQNTSYTTGQARRIILSTSNPSGGGNGDVWIKYV